MIQLSQLKEIMNNKNILVFIITLQESFVAIVPFFLLTSLLSLLYQFMLYFDITLFSIETKEFEVFVKMFQSFTSFVAVVAISFFFAIRFKVSQIIAVILAVAIYLSTLFELKHGSNYLLSMPYGFTPDVIFLPILSTYFLKIFYSKFSLKIVEDGRNYHIYSLFNYLFVFFVVYGVVNAIYFFMKIFVVDLLVSFNPLDHHFPDIVTLVIRNFMVELSWFFGVHGEHLINGVFGKDILFQSLFENLTYGEFNRIFVMLGGAGIGLGLLISLLLYAKDKTIQTITKVSIPFSIFNINNLLIYAVVVFNRFLIIPFILLPVLNLFIAYFVLQILDVEFTNYYVTWTTPSFVDSYLKTNGNLSVVFLQLALLVIDIVIYSYFVRKFLKSQSTHQHIEALEEKLNLNVELKSLVNVEAYKAQKDIIEANIKVEDLIEELDSKNLFVYYQPKVDIKRERVLKFEALLRYKKDEKIIGPVFLDTIEQSGLAHIIDLWVALRVKENLKQWKKENYTPIVSINLHPDTLKSDEVIDEIISMFAGEKVFFEIIERSFLFKNAEENLARLQKEGFGLSIDDYGTGYSSLETIVKHDIDELKLDKSLLDVIGTKKGYLLCKYTTELCHELNITVVAEGIEQLEQLHLAKEIGVDLVQGYYFSKAISFEEVKSFNPF